MVQASISSRCYSLLAASLSPAPDSEPGKFQDNWRQDLCEGNRAGLGQGVIADWISGNLSLHWEVLLGAICGKDNYFPLPSICSCFPKRQNVSLWLDGTLSCWVFKISKYGLLAYHASIPL